MVPQIVNKALISIQSPVPFWFINGHIGESQVTREIEMMHEKSITEFVVHPRYGLQVEYLSDAWFEIFGWCVREAKKHGMALWVYDELNWPSGTAGMTVQKADPGFKSKHLAVEARSLAELDLDVFQPGLVVVAANIESGRVTKTRLIEDPAVLRSLTGAWTIFNCTLRYDEFYIDTLSSAAVEHFRDVTYGEYYRRFAEDFGQTIRAFFTDEPSIYWVSVGHDDCNLPYTDDFFDTFQQRFGYSPVERIPYLFYPGSHGAAFRADYWDHAGHLFNERYHGTLSSWCGEHSVVYTGHNHYEEPLRYQIRFQGDMFGAMRSMDLPGVDHLGKATLGNHFISIIGHKIASSSAHVSGKPRVMSESFGVMDWDTTFTNLKRVTDWQYALGVNLLVPHALYHTIAGPTKRECPPSFFYQSPHWADFDHFTDYVRRLELMLTGGRHVCKVAVLYPLTGLWSTYQTDRKTPEFEHMDNFLNSLCLELMRGQVDFDILDFDSLSQAELADGKLKLADEEYQVLIIPSTPYMRLQEVRRLTEIVRSGVHTTFFYKSMEPIRESVPDSLKGANFVAGDQLTPFVQILRKQLDDDILITGGGSDDIMVYRREKDDRKITFLLNRSEKHRKVMAMLKDYPDAAVFDPETGSYTRLEGRKAGLRTQAELRFQPDQSYFIVSNVPDAAIAPEVSRNVTSVPVTDLTAHVPLNVASIYHFTYNRPDSAPVEMDIRANPRYIPQNTDRNPPDFERYAGIYEAEIEVNLPGDGISTILDADYASCQVYINGLPVKTQPAGEEYLTDFQDLRADIGALLRQGRNTIRVVSPTKLSEPVRLVGDFRVHVAGRLLVLVPPGELDPLHLERDYPFYSGTVTYTASFDLQNAFSPLELHLPSVHDTVEVWVNGRYAGKRLWGPYKFDIASMARQGTNGLEIRVRNNAANLMLGTSRPIGLKRAPTLTGFE